MQSVISSSPYWPLLNIRELTINMRLQGLLNNVHNTTTEQALHINNQNRYASFLMDLSSNTPSEYLKVIDVINEEFHEKIINKLDYFYRNNKIPHIIFHGSACSGKHKLVNDFILKIYKNDKKKIKTNVMTVNCAHGKGIKFIREELKFFAKTNIHLSKQTTSNEENKGIIFKTIILIISLLISQILESPNEVQRFKSE
jgi:hypothetical protein